MQAKFVQKSHSPGPIGREPPRGKACPIGKLKNLWWSVFGVYNRFQLGTLPSPVPARNDEPRSLHRRYDGTVPERVALAPRSRLAGPAAENE
jgi:hypothetical protein